MGIVHFDIAGEQPGGVQTITAYQAKAALGDAGLLQLVEDAINNPDTPLRVKLAWSTSINFRRDNPMILLLTEKLGLSASDVNDLFDHAATIVQGGL